MIGHAIFLLKFYDPSEVTRRLILKIDNEDKMHHLFIIKRKRARNPTALIIFILLHTISTVGYAKS